MATESELSYVSATELAKLMRSKSLRPVDLTQTLLDRIDHVDSQLNAFCTVTHDTALKAARQAERDISSGVGGPLCGIPFWIKDLSWTAGVRTMSGSFVFEQRVTDLDAPVVRRLRSAGGIMLGKTTTPEFGWKAVGDSPVTGVTRNPWDPALTAGGGVLAQVPPPPPGWVHSIKGRMEPVDPHPGRLLWSLWPETNLRQSTFCWRNTKRRSRLAHRTANTNGS